jgi:hypothetical protein
LGNGLETGEISGENFGGDFCLISRMDWQLLDESDARNHQSAEEPGGVLLLYGFAFGQSPAPQNLNLGQFCVIII